MEYLWGKNEGLYIWEKGKSGGHDIAGNLLSLNGFHAFPDPQGQKKTPGNDSVSIIISRCLSVKFIADT